MRRLLVLGVVFASALGLFASEARAAVAYPTRMQVTAREFSLVLSRLRVPTGPFRVQLVNFGEDDHDLRFRRIGGTRLYRVPVTRPGAVTTVNTHLYRAGTFRVWCSLPGHREAGMRGTFTAYRRS